MGGYVRVRCCGVVVWSDGAAESRRLITRNGKERVISKITVKSKRVSVASNETDTPDVSVTLSAKDERIRTLLAIRDHEGRERRRHSIVPATNSIIEDPFLESMCKDSALEPETGADRLSRNERKRLVRRLSKQIMDGQRSSGSPSVKTVKSQAKTVCEKRWQNSLTSLATSASSARGSNTKSVMSMKIRESKNSLPKLDTDDEVVSYIRESYSSKTSSRTSGYSRNGARVKNQTISDVPFTDEMISPVVSDPSTAEFDPRASHADPASKVSVKNMEAKRLERFRWSVTSCIRNGSIAPDTVIPAGNNMSNTSIRGSGLNICGKNLIVGYNAHDMQRMSTVISRQGTHTSDGPLSKQASTGTSENSDEIAYLANDDNFLNESYSAISSVSSERNISLVNPGNFFEGIRKQSRPLTQVVDDELEGHFDRRSVVDAPRPTTTGRSAYPLPGSRIPTHIGGTFATTKGANNLISEAEIMKEIAAARTESTATRSAK